MWFGAHALALALSGHVAGPLECGWISEAVFLSSAYSVVGPLRGVTELAEHMEVWAGGWCLSSTLNLCALESK